MAWALMIGGGLLAVFALIGISNKKAAVEAGLKTKQAAGVVAFGLVLVAFGYGLKVDSVEGPGLQVVLATIQPGQAHTWETGQVGDGVAVVVNGSAGYWVRDGVAFAVNGVAKSLSPELEYARAVVWTEVEAAVQ